MARTFPLGVGRRFWVLHVFEYLIERIAGAPMIGEPYPHLFVSGLFTEEHFRMLIAQPEIDISAQHGDRELIDTLESRGYRVIDFPGCMTDRDAYCRWRGTGGTARLSQRDFKGEFGMVLRLIEPRSEFTMSLHQFLASDRFAAAIAARFDVDAAACVLDTGIQKYLDGYQISPHPDIRGKALTWMANIYPGPDCEEQTFHTRLDRFDPAYAYIGDYWAGNPEAERCHLPWHTVTTRQRHSENNSLVAFAPGDHTLHSVKAWYDHLGAQRTQIYGNLWLREKPRTVALDWPQLEIRLPVASAARKAGRKLVKAMPAPVYDFIQRVRAPRLGRGVHRRTTG